MPRKKKTQPEATGGTAIADQEPITSAPVDIPPVETSPIESARIRRPEWIDGAPVDADGQVIRESSRPAPLLEPAAQPQAGEMQQAEPHAETHGKSWGDPYKSIFSCPEMGFELGENRRFKQRVFRFVLKPTSEILSELKEHGFTYRAGEKAWTINATPQSRKLTDDLARSWAGPNYVQGVER
jgi:hypothetical protein